MTSCRGPGSIPEDPRRRACLRPSRERPWPRPGDQRIFHRLAHGELRSSFPELEDSDRPTQRARTASEDHGRELFTTAAYRARNHMPTAMTDAIITARHPRSTCHGHAAHEPRGRSAAARISEVLLRRGRLDRPTSRASRPGDHADAPSAFSAAASAAFIDTTLIRRGRLREAARNLRSRSLFSIGRDRSHRWPALRLPACAPPNGGGEIVMPSTDVLPTCVFAGRRLSDRNRRRACACLPSSRARAGGGAAGRPWRRSSETDDLPPGVLPETFPGRPTIAACPVGLRRPVRARGSFAGRSDPPSPRVGQRCRGSRRVRPARLARSRAALIHACLDVRTRLAAVIFDQEHDDGPV